MVLPSLKGMWINCLLAVSLAFLIASGTCLAFACAIPIFPAWLPTTTNAAKANHNLAVKYVQSTLLKASIDDGYFRGYITVKDFNCGRAQDVKILPNSESTVMNYMVYHLQCSITEHPFNNTQYPALGFGPRGILGSVEFYSRCTNKKPMIHIQTVYNDNNDKLENSIEISEFGGYC